MKKTYAVKGLIEWNAVVRSGGVSLKVPFTGGSHTKYGTIPAQFSTESEIVQLLIENCNYFKTGRIYRL